MTRHKKKGLVTVRVDEALRARMDAIYAREGMPLSEQVRRGIEIVVEQKEREHAVLARKGVR